MKESKVTCDWCKSPIEGERYEQLIIDGKEYQIHKQCKQEIKNRLGTEGEWKPNKKATTEKKKDQTTSPLESVIDIFVDNEDGDESE